MRMPIQHVWRFPKASIRIAHRFPMDRASPTGKAATHSSLMECDHKANRQSGARSQVGIIEAGPKRLASMAERAHSLANA